MVHLNDAKKSSPAFAGLLFGFFAGLLFLTACGNPTGQLTASLGKRFSLAINQTAVISGENITIKFIDINDSRCPAGATCIWAGEARADILIGDGSTDNLTLVEPGYSPGTNQTYKNYVLTFEVQPYPVVNQTIEKGEYRLILKVIIF